MKKTIKIKQTSTKNRPNIGPKSVQNRSKIGQNRSKIGSGADFASESVFGPILERFWTQLGAILGAQIGPCWGQVDPKIDFWRSWMAFRNEHDFWYLSEPISDRFWGDLGVQNRPKIAPESVSRASMKRMQHLSKTQWIHSENGLPEGSKIDQKSIKIGSENGLKSRSQNNTPKWSKKCPTWLQNRPKLGPCWVPKPSWTRPRAKKNDTQRRQPKNTQKHKPDWQWTGSAFACKDLRRTQIRDENCRICQASTRA